MSHIKRLAVSVVAASALSCCNYVSGRTIELKVVNQSGEPVPEAKVRMNFYQALEGDVRKGVTDDEGKISLRGSDDFGVEVKARKSGYYSSSRRVGGDDDKSIKFVLRDKKDPIPMYVKEKWLYFPKKDERIGFDFKVGDWVEPYGEGYKAHIYFTLEGADRGLHDGEGTLTVSFPNEAGGIQPASRVSHYSVHKFPYKAPRSGYSANLVHEYAEIPNDNGPGYKERSTRSPKRLGYIFEIAKKDKENQMVKQYGKILNEFHFSVGKNKERESVGFVKFTYYFNPNPKDRNIEFDPQRNLFKDAEKTYPP